MLLLGPRGHAGGGGVVGHLGVDGRRGSGGRGRGGGPRRPRGGGGGHPGRPGGGRGRGDDRRRLGLGRGGHRGRPGGRGGRGGVVGRGADLGRTLFIAAVEIHRGGHQQHAGRGDGADQGSQENPSERVAVAFG